MKYYRNYSRIFFLLFQNLSVDIATGAIKLSAKLKHSSDINFKLLKLIHVI